MRRRARARILTPLAAGAAAVIALGLAAPTPASASADLAAVSPYLSKQLSSLSGKTVVLVHGKSLADATKAVSASGLTKVVTFKKIGVVGARGTKAQIQSVRSQPNVTYVEAGAQPIRFFAETSNKATRGLEATQTLTGADGSALTGKGVSVGVIDSGVDPTHPYFKEADGSSAVVASYKTLCDPTESQCTVLKVPTSIDTDTLSLGGHGTHVNGIVAGRPTMVGGALQQGAAPGAKLVDLSEPACSSSVRTPR
jgi:serine protease AprX